MDILLAFIVGGVLGIGVHYAAPEPHTRGVAVGPVLGAFVGGIVWLAFTWSGVTTESPWIWLVSFVAPLIVTYPALVVLGRIRIRSDERERVLLKIA